MDHSTDETCPTKRNQDIFEKWFCSAPKDKKVEIRRLVQSLFQLNECTEDVYQALEKYCDLLCVDIHKKWQKCHRNRNRFLIHYQEWLNSPCVLPVYVTSLLQTSLNEGNQPGCSRGRPQKRFVECCPKTKKRRVEKLVASHSAEELRFAASLTSPSEVKDQSKCLTPTEALSLYFDLDLSERKYNILRSVVNALHQNCFPSLYSLKLAKKQLLPKSISVTETSAEVNLQEILNKTVESISKLTCINKNTTVKLICKWGFDGSGGHSIYKQKFTDAENTDEYLFLIAFVPLKLVDIDCNDTVWDNERSASSFYCRPIKFIFKKECQDLILQEESEISKQIHNIKKHKICIGDINVEVVFELHLTMVDGSICNILSETNSTSKCYICGAKPTEMNLTKTYNKPSNDESYRFGLSSLHCWIRTFECLLHIAYRLPFKSWQVRGAEKRSLFEKEKSRIQEEFKRKMGLIVDKPKQGFGSSNDGNTARRFFADPKLSAEITGIDEKMIKNFSLILRVVASGRIINLEKFNKLTIETKELYLELYKWYYMPCTVHKLLIHGADIIHYFDQLPIGKLSEEALEAMHKVFRHNRLNHTRKNSRLNTCKDLMDNMLLMSDPVISSKRNITSRRKKVDEDITNYFVTSDYVCSNNNDVNITLNNLDLDNCDITEDSD